MTKVNLLVTIDENYLKPLRAMLKSLFSSNRTTTVALYIIHKEISDESISNLNKFCNYHNNSTVHSVKVSDALFKDAPVNKHFSVAMYYRLLAHELLPDTIDRILYLDPDIMVINSIKHIYNLNLDDYLYAAAVHEGMTGISKYVNQVRLSNYETDGYYNSGVLMMNLENHRKYIDSESIFRFIKENKWKLILPDQDVINGLYGNKINLLDESIYNYDVERYETYKMVSDGKKIRLG